MRTRAITEGAMLAAITILMAFLSIYVGFVGLVIPVPLGLLVYRHGFRSGIVVAIMTAILAAITLNSVLLALELIIVGLLGIALGMALREKFSFIQILVVGVGASIVSSILKIAAYSALFGQNLIQLYLETWGKSSEHWLQVWESMGLPPEAISQYEQMLAMIPTTVQLLLPVLLLGIGLIQSLANLFVLRIILKRLGDRIPWFPPFVQWKWPWYFVWGFILGRLFMLLSLYLPGDIWQIIGLNLDVLFMYTFFIQGLAIVWFLLDRYRVHKAIRVIFVLLLFQPGSFLVLLVALGGILDTWFDFRKLKKGTEGST